ncbi:MAG: pantetheine-phosphate adenylyltransferase [Clostridiaceae bacterium]|jgi:pantetheine-phosphate adenylyltransferase|nr:pantetheine-phosphate adenylyltransferase [Clostridiaceae bacterium]
MTLVYPGSFDPITNGHLDIIVRAACICDKLIVAVGNNESKRPAFTVEERVEMIRASIGYREDIEVTSFTGLLADFAKKVGARAVIKGLRAMSDFEYEFQMALLNKKLEPELETLFMMTSVQYSFLSSSAVKEIARNGGCIDGLVPDCIRERIARKLTCR